MKFASTWIYLIFFIALSIVSTIWVLNKTSIDLSLFRQIDFKIIGLSFILGLAVYVVDSFRYYLYARALGDSLSLRICLRAVIANFFFSWITPAAILGMPATVFVLTKSGVKLDRAIVITTGKSLLGVALFLLLTFSLMTLGYGPKQMEGGLANLILWGGGIYVAILIFPLMWAIHPAPLYKLLAHWDEELKKFESGFFYYLKKFLKALKDTISTLEALLYQGGRWIIPIILSHIIYYLFFMATGLVLAMGLQGISLSDIFGPMTVFTAASLVAPTPGGAGVAEAIINACFVPPMTPDNALIIALGYRTMTFYLQTLIGLIWFILIIIRKRSTVEEMHRYLKTRRGV